MVIYFFNPTFFFYHHELPLGVVMCPQDTSSELVFKKTLLDFLDF